MGAMVKTLAVVVLGLKASPPEECFRKDNCAHAREWKPLLKSK